MSHGRVPGSSSYDYSSLPRGAGAPSPRGSVVSDAARSSRYDYIEQHRAGTRDSFYSQSPYRDSRSPEPVLQAGNGHPYPLRQQSVSPAPSYGAIRGPSPVPSYPTPNAPFLQGVGKRGSFAGTINSDTASSSRLAFEKMAYPEEQSATLLRKEGYSGAPREAADKRGFWTRRKIMWLLLLALLIAGIAIGLGVWQATKSKKSATNTLTGSNAQQGVVLPGTTSTSSSSSIAAPPTSSAAAPVVTPVVSQVQLWGGSGQVIMLNGTVFNYVNNMGGTWCAVPFNDSAQAQDSTPALNQPWDWSTDVMRGVNLGGWLVLEPFITPQLYAPFANSANPATDEWTLMESLGTTAASVIENHYATFITEADIAQIASVGLNWVRLPVPYWMIEVWDGEPFLEGVSWKYFQQAIAWCRKYGIRIELDLHTAPGSQNGLNHSGKGGSINVMYGIMGIANAQRTLNYIRTLAQFITQPEYVNVVQGFMVLNEPWLTTIGEEYMRTFYFQAYEMLRGIGGTGVGKGPMMMIHDGFLGEQEWFGFLQGADRVALETHPYLAFSPSSFGNSIAQDVVNPCMYWAVPYNQSMQEFGFTVGGEWSLAMNDCGEWILGVNNPATYTGNCQPFMDHRTFSAAFKQQLLDMTMAYQDSLRNNAFWTWKTGMSATTGAPANPLWSYSLGLANGWIPQDARGSIGACDDLTYKYGQGAAPKYQYTPPLAASATGGAGNNVIPAQKSLYGAWPPKSLSGYANVANFPTYTATATPITLSATSFPTSLFQAGVVVGGGNGWYDESDTVGYATAVAGCSYPNPWSGVGAPVPNAPCTGNGGAAVATPVAPAQIAATTVAPAPVVATTATGPAVVKTVVVTKTPTRRTSGSTATARKLRRMNKDS